MVKLSINYYMPIQWTKPGEYMRYAIWLIIILMTVNVYAQKSNKYNTYYNQKKSLFELLPNDKDEIIFLGNSITDGCEWHELFNDKRIKNRGISADISEGVLDRLDEVTESQPLQIFLMIGVNDLSRDISIPSIIENYTQIIRNIQRDSPETGIFIQSVLPVNDNFPRFKKHLNKSDKINILNGKLEELCGELQVTYIDLHSHFINEDGKLNPMYTNDGLHLTGPGYVKWKSVIEVYIPK